MQYTGFETYDNGSAAASDSDWASFWDSYDEQPAASTGKTEAPSTAEPEVAAAPVEPVAVAEAPSAVEAEKAEPANAAVAARSDAPVSSGLADIRERIAMMEAKFDAFKQLASARVERTSPVARARQNDGLTEAGRLLLG